MILDTNHQSAAIAVIFYVGNGLNNGEDTSKRILGFGLKVDYSTKYPDMTPDFDIASKYSHFYFAINYKDNDTKLAGTSFEEGWYLPTLPELILLRQNLNVFDLASSAWGMVVGGSYIDFANNFLTATPNAECDDGGNYRFNYIMCPNNCSINYVEKDGDRAFGNAQPWGVAVPIRVFNQ